MSRKSVNGVPMTPAERMKQHRENKRQGHEQYREMQQQRYEEQFRRIFEHHQYRLCLNKWLSQCGKETAWLANLARIDQKVIATGYLENCGLFRPEELAAIKSILPHMPAPTL